jgi:hypothetical protein
MDLYLEMTLHGAGERTDLRGGVLESWASEPLPQIIGEKDVLIAPLWPCRDLL